VPPSSQILNISPNAQRSEAEVTIRLEEGFAKKGREGVDIKSERAEPKEWKFVSNIGEGENALAWTEV